MNVPALSKPPPVRPPLKPGIPYTQNSFNFDEDEATDISVISSDTRVYIRKSGLNKMFENVTGIPGLPLTVPTQPSTADYYFDPSSSSDKDHNTLPTPFDMDVYNWANQLEVRKVIQLKRFKEIPKLQSKLARIALYREAFDSCKEYTMSDTLPHPRRWPPRPSTIGAKDKKTISRTVPELNLYSEHVQILPDGNLQFNDQVSRLVKSIMKQTVEPKRGILWKKLHNQQGRVPRRPKLKALQPVHTFEQPLSGKCDKGWEDLQRASHARAKIQFPEAIIDSKDLDWGDRGRLMIKDSSAKHLIEEAALWLPNDHPVLKDFEALGTWQSDNMIKDKDGNIDLLRYFLAHKCRIWITKLENGIIGIDITHTEDMDDARLAFFTLGKLHFLRRVCDRARVARCCWDKVGQPTMHQKLRSLINRSKDAADGNVTVKHGVEGHEESLVFFDIFANCNARSQRDSRLARAILLLDEADYDAVGVELTSEDLLRYKPRFRVSGRLSRSLSNIKQRLKKRSNEGCLATEYKTLIHRKASQCIQRKTRSSSISTDISFMSEGLVEDDDKVKTAPKYLSVQQETEVERETRIRRAWQNDDTHPREKGKKRMGLLAHRDYCACRIEWDTPPKLDISSESEDEDKPLPRRPAIFYVNHRIEPPPGWKCSWETMCSRCFDQRGLPLGPNCVMHDFVQRECTPSPEQLSLSPPLRGFQRKRATSAPAYIDTSSSVPLPFTSLEHFDSTAESWQLNVASVDEEFFSASENFDSRSDDNITGCHVSERSFSIYSQDSGFALIRSANNTRSSESPARCSPISTAELNDDELNEFLSDGVSPQPLSKIDTLIANTRDPLPVTNVDSWNLGLNLNEEEALSESGGTNDCVSGTPFSERDVFFSQIEPPLPSFGEVLGYPVPILLQHSTPTPSNGSASSVIPKVSSSTEALTTTNPTDPTGRKTIVEEPFMKVAESSKGLDELIDYEEAVLTEEAGENKIMSKEIITNEPVPDAERDEIKKAIGEEIKHVVEQARQERPKLQRSS